MPNCTVEYAEVLKDRMEISTFAIHLHEALAASPLFNEKDVKVWAAPVPFCLVGGEVKPIIHITIKLLAGRTLAQREALSQSIVSSSKGFLSGLGSIALSVEVIELEVETEVET